MAPVKTDRYQTIKHSYYATNSTVTEVLTVIFCYCSHTSAAQIITGIFLLYICCWFRVTTFLSFWRKRGMGNLLRYYSDAEGPGHCGSLVFIAQEADGAGDTGSGNNTPIDVETQLVAFVVDYHNWGLLLACRSVRNFGGSAFGLKEFYCKWRIQIYRSVGGIVKVSFFLEVIGKNVVD